MTDQQFSKKSHQHHLENESLVKFRVLFGSEHFEIRDERVSDAGVDLSLELTPNGLFLNMRSQVQIKATKSPDLNSDESYSYSIEVKNINYLLNGGQSPMYVLYIKSVDELRYAWARDESLRLDRENKNWKKQATVTIRFTKQLNDLTLPDIAKRISDESTMNRVIFEKLNIIASKGLVDLRIDLEALSAENSEDLLNTIINHGLEYVAIGKAKELIDIIKSIPSDRLSNALVQLVYAFALASLGYFPQAIGAISHARLIDTLNSEENLLLESISDACELQMGIIDVDTFVSNEESRALNANSDLALTLKLESARYKLYSAQSLLESEARLAELQKIGNEIESRRNLEPRMAKQKDAVLLYGEGLVLIAKVLHQITASNVREKAKLDSNRDLDFRQISEDIQKYQNSLNSFLESTSFVSDPVLESDLLLTRFMVTVFTLHTFLANCEHMIVDSPELFDDARRIEVLANDSGNLQLVVQVRLLEANLHGLLGRTDEAKRIANTVIPIAKALQINNFLEEATKIVDGHPLAHRIRDERAKLGSVSTDDHFLTMSDAEAETYANTLCSMLLLPDDRAQQILVEINANRKTAALKHSWCRHLILLCRNIDEVNKDTAYREECLFKCKCVEKDVVSERSFKNVDDLYQDFMLLNCQNCVLKSPKSM